MQQRTPSRGDGRRLRGRRQDCSGLEGHDVHGRVRRGQQQDDNVVLVVVVGRGRHGLHRYGRRHELQVRHSGLRADHQRQVDQRHQQRHRWHGRVHTAGHGRLLAAATDSGIRAVVFHEFRRTGNRQGRHTVGRMFIGRPQARLPQGVRQKQVVPAVQARCHDCQT